MSLPLRADSTATEDDPGPAAAIVPATNDRRLAALHQSRLLDSPREEFFDHITAVVARVLRVPVSLISLVEGDRQFFKSEQGLPEPWASQRQTALSHSFCQHVAASGEPLIVEDARNNALLRKNLAIPDIGVVAYAGMPLTTADGHTLGSLCAIDTQPRQWTDVELETLRALASLVMTEIELRLSAEQLQENVARLERTESDRRGGMRALVHDLRTPLQSMLFGLQTLPLLGTLSAEQQQCLDLSARGGEQLLRLIDELLDLSQMQSKSAAAVQYRTLAPEKLIEAAMDQVRPLAQHAGLDLRHERDAEPLPPISGDEEKLVRVLVNLLGNAIKFTPRGGSVSAFAQRTALEKGDPAGREAVIFEVHDSGVGVPLDYQERIFDPFVQAPTNAAAPAPNGRSSGLGLTFCKATAETHGGRIWVESEPGHGSVFAFLIPLNMTSLPPQRRPEA